MRQLHQLIDEIRNSAIPVLLLGETGSGKEIIAERIHARSARAGQPFIRINCAGLSESVVESELFGHEKGAFTGASQAHRGIFEMANTGTLMLDEVAELPLRTQAKLLRVLETGDFSRLGSCESRRVDVRFIAATHSSLTQLMDRGQFRRDLYYRLCGAELHIPPLRERRVEIVPLARHFLQRFAAAERLLSLDGEAERALLAHAWPGNVRELRNVIEYAAARCNDGVVGAKLLHMRHGPRGLGVPALVAATSDSKLEADAPSQRLRELICDFERDCLRAALDRCRQNRTLAARELGISRRALTRKLSAYQMTRGRAATHPSAGESRP